MEELTMSVSGICVKEGRKCAYVSFAGADRYAEGTIPDCKITEYRGFTEEEAKQLELYMKMNLGELKRRAAFVDPVRAMMKDGKIENNRKK